MNVLIITVPAFILAPALDKIYPDKKDLSEAMQRHLVFYNSHVNFDAAILGLSAAMEESTPPDGKDGINPLKTGLMEPFAGLGDSLIKFTWIPIVGSIGASLAFSGSIVGPILMFILYNIVNIFGRYYAVIYGYKKGIAFLHDNKKSNIIQRISTMANVVGLMVVGSLISTVIKVKTPLQITVQSQISSDVANTIEVQAMLDKIMPSVLSLLVTVAVYYILKRTDGKHAALIIILMMCLTVILKYFGIV